MSTETATGMPGLMMRTPLLIRGIAARAEQLFAQREIVTVTAEGIERSDFATVVGRARRLASALQRLGITSGDRVASFAWNSQRHLELYLAVPAMGAVLHTLNIRLFDDDLHYIVGHAEDRVIFLDASLADRMPRFEGVEHEILMPDADTRRDGALDYESLIESGDPNYEFPELDEDLAAAMCYTSGTTGRPKGVVYSHRSTVLHALMTNLADGPGLRERDAVMPIVPMFHANAWGLPYAAALAGSKLVFPGPRMDPADLAAAMQRESVTIAAAVPTIFQGIGALEPAPKLPALERLVCGGSAVPESLMRLFDERFGVGIIQAWGMTETSPMASVSRVPPHVEDPDEAMRLRATQGRVVPFVEYRIDEAEQGDSSAAQPGEVGSRAGRKREGELQVRGPTIASAYYEDETGAEKFTSDGWLKTGDVAELTDGAFIKLVDRTKDLVKSGGEWISSVELENLIMDHPEVAEAAVVAVPNERWGERPCACVVRRAGSSLSDDALREYLTDHVARWWLPDQVEFILQVPKTSVGKFDKKVLRAQLAEGRLERANT